MTMQRHDASEIKDMLSRAAVWAQAGETQDCITRKLGISVMTLHRWRRRYGSFDVVDSANLETKSDELSRLEQENRMLRDLLVKQVLALAEVRSRLVSM